MPETTAKREEELGAGVSSRDASNESSLSVPKTERSDERYSYLKRRFMNELGLGDYYEIQLKDSATFNRLLESRIEQQRKEVEEQRDRNLKTLSAILDKCIKSEKITGNLIERILDYGEMPIQEGSSQDPGFKRRKLASPMTSPKGHRRFLSEAHAVPSKETQGFAPQVSSMQGTYPLVYHAGAGAGPTPWLPQQYNTPMPAQTQYQSSFPAGLGVPVSREPSMAQNNENQAGVRSGSYSPSHMVSVMNPVSSLHQAGPTGRAPAMVIRPESPQKGPAKFLQPSHQTQQHYRMKAESTSQLRYPGHRRSQSATVVPPNASASNSTRSPIRELQASPQKPVNFLIHTPKHPPPT